METRDIVHDQRAGGGAWVLFPTNQLRHSQQASQESQCWYKRWFKQNVSAKGILHHNGDRSTPVYTNALMPGKGSMPVPMFPVINIM